LKSNPVGGNDFLPKPYGPLISPEKNQRALELANPNNFREPGQKEWTLEFPLSISKYPEKSL